MTEKLNQHEIHEVKELVEIKPSIEEVVASHNFRKLLWKTLRIWAGYIAAAIVGTWSVVEVALKFINLRG